MDSVKDTGLEEMEKRYERAKNGDFGESNRSNRVMMEMDYGDNRIHILPREGTNKFYVDYYVHKNVGLVKTNKKGEQYGQWILCTKKTKGIEEPCILCEENKKNFDNTEKNSAERKEVAKTYAREVIRIAVYDWAEKDETKKVKIWRTDAKTLGRLMVLFFGEKKDADGGGYDGKSIIKLDGPDILVNLQKDKNGFNDYFPRLSSRHGEIPPSVLENIPDLMPKKPTEEMCQKALNGEDIYNNSTDKEEEGVDNQEAVEQPKEAVVETWACFIDDDKQVKKEDCMVCKKRDKCPTAKEKGIKVEEKAIDKPEVKDASISNINSTSTDDEKKKKVEEMKERLRKQKESLGQK
jgi:hypothetical protein